MRLRSKSGVIGIFFFVFLTICIWLYVRIGTPKFNNYGLITHSMGQLTGLVGLTLFALTFILTTRLKFIEKSFGGLDKVYKTHHLIGSLAFVLLLFHPILLVLKFIPSNFRQAMVFLLPSTLPVNLGIIALLSMTLVIILTLYISMKYQNWKLSHKLMGIVFFIALTHIFLITTDIMFYPILKYYMAFIALIGSISYIYGSFLRSKIKKSLPYLLESVEVKESFTILNLKPKKSKLLFQPGQFVFIKIISNKITRETHPFSIASSPQDKNIRLAIKNLGDYTSTLKDITPGTEIEIEGPYGEFGNIDYSKKQIWIAGGIGITPFLSIISNITNTKTITENIKLYYCVKNHREAIFFDELNSSVKKLDKFEIITWFSDEKGIISVEDIEKANKISKTNFLICGPPRMMKSLSQQLIEKGVSKSNIYMEDFDLK
jgi:predicted ferric reductase